MAGSSEGKGDTGTQEIREKQLLWRQRREDGKPNTEEEDF